MCTILLAWRCAGFAPVVIAANRDELIARPSAPPELLNTWPPIHGGRDLIAGGTWLAVAEDGRLAAVTNRRVGDTGPVTRDPDRRSRGEIPVVLLRPADEAGVASALAGLGPGTYNPVNVLYASPGRALVAHVDDTAPPRVFTLEPGPHVLTVFDLDDRDRPKVAALRRKLEAALAEAVDTDDLRNRMVAITSSPDTPTGDPLDAACIHGDEYGTVSASTVMIDGAGVDYRHAQGRPCVTPFQQVVSRPTSG